MSIHTRSGGEARAKLGEGRAPESIHLGHAAATERIIVFQIGHAAATERIIVFQIGHAAATERIIVFQTSTSTRDEWCR